jgi:histidinol dehydrogenase
MAKEGMDEKLIETILLNRKNKEQIKEACRHKCSEDKLAEGIEDKVREIILKVKKEGDNALLEYTKKYDGARLNPLEILVGKEEWAKTSQEVNEDLLEVIKEAIKKIKNYHLYQKENSWFTTEERGIILGQVVNPIKRVGLYVPGGTAAYPSSLIMAAVPAIIAGVKEIVVVTPPSSDGKINPYLLSTAKELNISEIYKIGGAQAIAALTYGTETVKKVDKIVGPGNIYVTLAKKNVYGEVDIDMLAGPSEILIWADDKANPLYLACDLLSQAEHDVEASAILITVSSLMADKVRKEIEQALKNLNRKKIIQESLKKKGKLIVAEDEGIILDFINDFAPEHLELQVENPWQILGEIKNAGAIFIGAYSPEPLGDYWAGPNHILPTSGGARCFSPLSVKDFTKRSSIIFYDKERLGQASEKIASFARLEGLEAHARSIEIRNLE